MTWLIGFLVYVACGVEWFDRALRHAGKSGRQFRDEIRRLPQVRDRMIEMEQRHGRRLDWIASVACVWVIVLLILLWPYYWLSRVRL